MKIQQPRVGIGVMLFQNRQVLLGRRKNAHGAGEYGFPGGHLDHLESFEDCAKREVREECGLEIEDIRFLLVANVAKYRPKHYVHLTLTAQWKSGVPAVREPDKSEDWAWYALDNLPEPMFETCRLSFDSYANGTIYYDAGYGGKGI
jgi:8-oxo-dGTP diphosphatase